ncbi:MAG: zinc-dependent alcohol dehydrogenase family protein [Fimbriimonas sp.]
MVLSKQAPMEEGPLELRWVPIPVPAPGQIRVRVLFCAICRTDLHVIEGDLVVPRMPLIPGHQIVGTVDQLGDNCGRFRIGQRVGVAWLRETDGTCHHCLRGRENLCEKSRFTGFHEDGGYAEYTVVREDFAYPLPDAFDDLAASPLLCAGLIGFRALNRTNLPDGGNLLLIGFGSSAHIVIQLATYRGHRVQVVSREERHRDLCIKLGAVWAGAAIEHVTEKVDGAILFAPVGELVPPALRTLDRGGVLSIAGIHLSDIPSLNYQNELFFERELRTVTANTRPDGYALLAEAAQANVRPQLAVYPLQAANAALLDLKQDRIAGTGVLRVND